MAVLNFPKPKTEAESSNRHRVLGLLFGYPQCCINQFRFDHETDKEQRFKAGNRTGFIPCSEHAAQVNRGEVKLESIIRPSRSVTTKFPIHKREDISIGDGVKSHRCLI